MCDQFCVKWSSFKKCGTCGQFFEPLYSKKIFCRVLFDLEPDQLWGHPDFEVFKCGYNIHLQYGNPGSRTFLQFFHPGNMLSLVAGLYNPRIVHADLIISRLRFEISGSERMRERKDTREDFAQLFVRVVHQYVKGLGHPQHELVSAFQTLTKEEIACEADSPHTRPHLLLAVFTESKLWPRDDLGWTLKFIMEDPQVPDDEISSLSHSSLLLD
ncbi:hypothetical protein HWV62_15607 [Athelia sp. TMB]|nr:hypothetical protein HWV62_15607 [Athelia sp. TMB]